MQLTLSPPLLSRLSELVAAQTGLYFPQYRWGDLERGIASAAHDFNHPDSASCAQWLLSAPLTRNMNEVLASHLSIGETYFFREPQSLDILGEKILAPLLQERREKGRRLRIWSAGCSTGEEAYTLAIMLDRLLPDLKDWNITILATDFNPKFLRKAALGVYGEWSFRNAPSWLREQYFTRGGDGRFALDPRIKKMVTFSYLNFAEDIYPSLSNNTSAMDVILCRNVLMYFTAQRAKQVAGNLQRALVEGGWLIVSLTEASNSMLAPLTPVEFPEARLYRKGADGALTIPPIATEHIVGEPPVAGRVLTRHAQDGRVGLKPDLRSPTKQTVQEPAPQPNGHEKLSGMARSCADQGKLDEALIFCGQAIAADKMNPAQHYLNATILQEQGQHEAAIGSLTRALYLDPEFVLAHFALGNLHQSQGRYRDAQRYFGNVLQLLREHQTDEALTEADGLTAGRLAEIVTSLLESLPQDGANA